MGFVREFREFALKGNLVDIAVAFVMGGAFGKAPPWATPWFAAVELDSPRLHTRL